MMQLCGKPEQEITDELAGAIFRNPLTQQWETSDEYLSGNVREKLVTAETFAANHAEYQINVDYLKRVQPKDLDASEIEVRLGANWVKPEYITQFMKEVFKTPNYYAGIDIKATYSEISGAWNISGKSLDRGNPLVTNTYGTLRVNGYKLLEDALNLRDTKIYDTIHDADGDHRVLNKQETMLAQQAQESIREAFKQWIFKDVNKLGFAIVRENFRKERNDWKLDLRVGEGSDAIELEIFAESNPPKRVNRPEACGLRHLAFRVDDVEATVAELEQMGIGCEPIRLDSYTQKKMTFFFDPDGLPLELHE